MDRRTIGWFMLVTACVGAAILLGTQHFLHDIDPSAIRVTTPGARLTVMTIVGVVMFLGGIVMYPIAVAIVLGAALVGPAIAWAVFPGAMSGAILGWFIGHKYGERALHRFSADAVQKLIHFVERHAALSAALIRWVPGLPFALQNAGIGAAGGALIPFVLGTMVGIGVSHSVMIATGVAAIEVVQYVVKSVRMGWVGIAVVFIGGVLLLLNSTATVENAQSEANQGGDHGGSS